MSCHLYITASASPKYCIKLILLVSEKTSEQNAIGKYHLLSQVAEKNMTFTLVILAYLSKRPSVSF